MSERPAGATDPAPAQFGRFAIHLAERRLSVDGAPVTLGSRAFDLLAALVTRRDRVVPKDELIEVVWPGLVVEDNNLQVQISALRKVLGTQAISTVPGRGYQFTVAAQPAPAATPPGARPSRAYERPGAGRPRTPRLLVADDNKVNRLLLCRSLELMGHDVTTVENGRSALERLRAEPFDLLLLDLEMPELDGFGLLEQRADDAALQDVPVIVTSSLEGAAAVARCIELGADDYLHKPVNPVLLKARVDASLERKRLRDHQRELLARLGGDRPEGASAAADAVGRHVEATLLSARLHGIDALAALQPAQDTLELLSSWTTLMLDAIEGQGGIVHQMAGDAVAAVFGMSGSEPASGGAIWPAVQAALEMRELVAAFNAERAVLAKPAIALAIGIARGSVVAGRAGPLRRTADVCVGAAVQRAARLEELAGGLGAGTVLLDGSSRVALAGRVVTDTLAPAVLPGSADAVPVHALENTA